MHTQKLAQSKTSTTLFGALFIQQIQKLIKLNKNKQNMFMNQQTTFFFPFRIDLREYQSLQTVQQIKRFYEMLIHTEQYRNKRIISRIMFYKDKYQGEGDQIKKVRIVFTCCKIKNRYPFFLYIKGQVSGTYELQQCLTEHDHRSILLFQTNKQTEEKGSSISPENQKKEKSKQRQKPLKELKILFVSNDPNHLDTIRGKFHQPSQIQFQNYKLWRLYDIPISKELVDISNSRGRKKNKDNQKSKFQKEIKQLESQGYVQYNFPLQKQLTQIRSFDTVDQMIQTLQKLLELSHHREKKIQFRITVNPYSEVQVSFPCCNTNFIRPFISYKNTKRSHCQLESCNLVHYHNPDIIVKGKSKIYEVEKQQTNNMNKLQDSQKPVKQSQKEQKS